MCNGDLLFLASFLLFHQYVHASAAVALQTTVCAQSTRQFIAFQTFIPSFFGLKQSSCQRALNLVTAKMLVSRSSKGKEVHYTSSNGHRSSTTDFSGEGPTGTAPFVHDEDGTVRQPPMVHLLLLRHGQTDWNAESRIQGSSDYSRLTDKGIQQARAAGSFMKTLNISKIFISPLSRAQQTLEFASEKLAEDGKYLPVPTILNDLREIDLYEWQGLLKEEVKSKYPNEYVKWRGNRPSEFQVVSGHYPVKELWERARRVWREVLSDVVSDPASRDTIRGGSTLLIGHNALNQALLCTFMGLGEDTFRQLEIPNCGLLEMEWALTAAPTSAEGQGVEVGETREEGEAGGGRAVRGEEGDKAAGERVVTVAAGGLEARSVRWRKVYPAVSEWTYAPAPSDE